MRRLLFVTACALAACSTSGTSSSSGSSAASSSGTGSSGSTTGGTTGGSTTGSTGGPTALGDLLRDLRADAGGTLQAHADGEGWPLPLDGGYLFVSTDASLGYVAGDFDGWTGEPLHAESGFSWAVVAASAGNKYKFTDHANYAADPYARAYFYDEHGEISWIHPSGVQHLERWTNVGDANVQPRQLRVLVPQDAVTHVLYAHDGENLFDPNAAWGGWKLQDSAPPGMLIVGIDNTPARFDEYTHVTDIIDGSSSNYVGGKGDAYADFVLNTVRPLIRAKYGEPGKVGTMGSSLGGLISLYLANRDPAQWDFAASLSGTQGWGSIGDGVHHTTIIERFAQSGHQSTVLYVDSGGNGDTCADSDGDGIDDDDPSASDNYCENEQLRDVLLAHGYTDGADLTYYWEPGATHDEAHWAARVFRPLQRFAAQ